MRLGTSLVLVAAAVIGVGAYVSDNQDQAVSAPETRSDGVTAARHYGTPVSGSSQLAALHVAPEGSMNGYSRDAFGHGWKKLPGQCSTRVRVLQHQGNGVRVVGDCTITAGSWTSIYDGVKITDGHAGQLDVDHLVPLAESWRTGAASWSRARRVQFANDMRELIAVTRHSNRSKGDEPPPDYRPVSSQWCTYARRWVAIKTTYGLSVTTRERSALAGMLGTCSGGAR